MADAPLSYEKKEVLVSIKDISLKFGNKTILQNVNAEIHNIVRPDKIQGQVVCFLGPSGIGKTQLSRIIAGLQPPTSGSVSVDSRPTHKGRVGVVSQTSTLFEFATLGENLKIAAAQGKTSLDRVKELVLAFELELHYEKYPTQLSGGQRQRAAIVRQLVAGHQTILMDEPFSGLDLKMKQQACRMITEAANLDEKNTIIVVTHDVTEGMSIADTVWLMGKDGIHEGAGIIEQYDLAAMGLCWTDELLHEPNFQQMVVEVKRRFLEIAAN